MKVLNLFKLLYQIATVVVKVAPIILEVLEALKPSQQPIHAPPPVKMHPADEAKPDVG
jgi:hypothetical protein